MPQEVADDREVKIHLAGVFRLKVVDLQIDGDEAAQAKPLPSSRINERRCSSKPRSSSRSDTSLAVPFELSVDGF